MGSTYSMGGHGRSAGDRVESRRASLGAHQGGRGREPFDGSRVNKPAKAPPPNYITPAGFKRLTDELTFLRTKKRPEVVNALSDAAAEGDRSENAEYIYRKRQLRQIDSRLRFLSKRLDDVRIVDPRAQPHTDRVFFGATVTVEDADGEEATYRIVGVDETDGAAGDISWQSPVGRALLGKSIGDTITVKWHAGVRELTVAEIDYR